MCVNHNIRLEEGWLLLPKLKWVKIKKHREIPEYHQLKSVTVSMTPTGKCYASLLYEYEAEIRPAARTGKAIGLDFSMESLFVSSEEEIRTEDGFLHRYRRGCQGHKEDCQSVKKGTFNSEWNSMKLEIMENALFTGDHSWNLPQMISPFNRIYFMIDGEAYLENENGFFRLLPGHMYLIPAGSCYNYVCTSMIHKYYFHFNLEIFPGDDVFSHFHTIQELPYSPELSVMRQIHIEICNVLVCNVAAEMQSIKLRL